MLDLFIETADKGAWKPGMPAPTILWFSRGEPKFTDLAILICGLRAGQVLRVVTESHSIQPALEAFCNEHLLRVVHATEERVLTLWGCFSHCYFDIEHV